MSQNAAESWQKFVESDSFLNEQTADNFPTNACNSSLTIRSRSRAVVQGRSKQVIVELNMQQTHGYRRVSYLTMRFCRVERY